MAAHFTTVWAQGSPAELTVLVADEGVPTVVADQTAEVVARCLYTMEVDSALLSGGVTSLAETVKPNLVARATKLIESMKTPLLDPVMAITKNLIAVVIGQVRQLETLRDADGWSKCMRYYATDTGVLVKCGETALEFGFVGNEMSTFKGGRPGTMIWTPETDAAYFQAMEAMGPAGNGVVKETNGSFMALRLARALGRPYGDGGWVFSPGPADVQFSMDPRIDIPCLLLAAFGASRKEAPLGEGGSLNLSSIILSLSLWFDSTPGSPYHNPVCVNGELGLASRVDLGT
jgi:hypothetical protein